MNVLSFDTETRGLDWFDPDHRAFLITYADADGEYIARLDGEHEPEVLQFIQAVDEADVLVAHNAPFDVHHIREAIGIDLLECDAELWDTDIMARVLHPVGQAGGPSSFKLKQLSKVYLRDDATDDEDAIKEMAKAIGLTTIKQTGAYYEVWRAYPDVMEDYALMDVRLTYDLFEHFRAELAEQPGLQKVMEIERTVAPILIRAEQRGVRLDKKRVAELLEQETGKRDEARDELDAEGVQVEGEGSEEALIDALQSHGVPLYRKTKTGQLSTNVFALQEFEDEFPVIRALQRYRKADKLVSTYLEPMSGRDVIHPSFQSIGAWTSRMSCRRPNMQNVPKGELRSVLVPRKGYSFIVADYDSIEMRLLAWYLGDEGYRDLVAGSDPHAWMASELWGGVPSDYAKGGARDADRGKAKNGLFAICYGAGAPRITDMFQLDKGTKYAAGDWEVRQGYKRVGDWKYEPAKKLINGIKSAIPNFDYLAGRKGRIAKKIQAVGYINTLFGRVQPVSKDKAYVGLNALIQGSAAEVMKQGLLNIASTLDDYEAHILLVVHDEVVIECKTAQAKQLLPEVEEAMIAAYPLDPPLAVTSAIVKTHYGDAK